MSEADFLNWIAELFEEPPDTLSAATSRDDVAAWNSLGVLTLIAALDEQHGILLSGEVAQRMSSVGDILQALREHGKLH